MILFSSFLSVFFGFLLILKKHKSKADFVLFFWMLLISMHLLLFYFNNNNQYKEYPHLIGVDMAFPVFHALFLFFYVRTITSKNQNFHKSDFLHLVPSLCAYTYMIPFFLKEGNAKYFYYQNIYNEEKYFIIFATIGFIISVIVYTWLTFNMISKYRSYIGQHYSFVEGINLLWMKRLLYGIVSLWTVVILIRLLGFYPNLVFFKEGNYLISVAASIFVIFLGFFGIRQTTVFAHHSFHEIIEEVKKTDDFKERYYKSGLKKEQVDLIKNKLIGLMESEKYYLDNKLSLNQLAKHIEINPNYLSQVINEHYSKNFYDFVNSYRIEEFKTKSKDPKFKNYSILALALECGFNSKSAFYSVFKKQLGVSPTEFLKINHNDNNL